MSDRFLVSGGARLHGEVSVGGAKNSVLKLMAASLLAEGTTTLTNSPEIADVPLMADVLRGLGAELDDVHGVLVQPLLAVLFLDLPFDRQAVAVPARHVGRIEAGQVARLDDDVLQDLVDRVAGVQLAIPLVKVA